ncbi:MAG: hypothetical protein ACRC3Y_10595 [Romboutsia sp.]|uniref:hypothetical protein n=1 Tax=Romboutsia sp. TaxID=1965302 RepID=UPI003F2F61B9
MEELVEILKEINDNIILLNEKLDDIKGDGLYSSLSDVCDKIEDMKDNIQGNGLYNNLSDVCDKLSTLETAIEFK